MAHKLMLAAGLAAALAVAEARAAEPAPKERPRRTILHFGEDDIRGGIKRPDGELVQAPKRVVEPSLVRVRRSFVDRALAAPLHGR